MSIDCNHPDYLDLRSRIRENPKDFVAIVGAGLSRPCGLPSWTELRDLLVKNAKDRISEIPEEEKSGYEARLMRISTNPELWQCFTELHDMLNKNAYGECIKDALTVKNKSDIPITYDLLWQIGIKGIITFNIDTCAIDSYSKVHGSAVDMATGKEVAKFPHFIAGPCNFVFQPHGHISDSTTWVFTEEEKTSLLGNMIYTDFMTSLCQTKHLLIIGFDPTDFAFAYLLQNALKGRSTIGSKHYIMLPRIDPGLINTFGDIGFAVIPYEPSDNLHPEIELTLRAFKDFLPEDDIPASVYTGGTTDLSTMPSDQDLIQMPVNEAREYLNRAVASIIPPNTTPHEDDIDKLEKFYQAHLKAIYMAWLIEPHSDFDMVHGYRVMDIKGRGAFGQVYEVEQIDTHERAALKVLLPEVRNDREYSNSFRRGVRSMRILTQRNVKKMVKLIDAFEVPACLLMEYVDGPTLTEAQSLRLLDSLPRCLEVLTQIGEVVHNAHNLDERVLHRDLKPDNVILRNSYNKSDPLDVVVLDFDLSWHKGAFDLSVAHGARAQGYAAPEQTATGRKKGISTRHTAVDVFGYGMLAFFIFVGDNPRPNEQNFKEFENHIKDQIKKRFSPRWRSLPSFLARTIAKCTLDEQSERMSFASALEAFREAYKMTCSDIVSASNPLILEEIAARVSPEGKVETSDFGRHLHVKGLDPSKEIDLKLESQDENVIVAVKLSKIRSEGDPRSNLGKYFETAKNKATSKLRKRFSNVQGSIGYSHLTVSGYLPLKQSFSGKEIDEACNTLLEARSSMTLE